MTYSFAGELIWEAQLPDAITVNDVKTVNGDVLAVVAGDLFLDTGGSIQRYNSDLDLVWATDPECPVVAMYAVPNGSVFVECKDRVSKINASGTVTLSTDLNLFLTQTSSIWEYWLSDYDDLFMPTVGTVDADGNQYFARSRAKVYALDGVVNLGALTVGAP